MLPKQKLPLCSASLPRPLPAGQPANAAAPVSLSWKGRVGGDSTRSQVAIQLVLPLCILVEALYTLDEQVACGKGWTPKMRASA